MQNFILPSPSKQVVCDKCSVSLKSIKCLVKHMRDMHSDQETCSYCSECGISKATRKQFQNHQRSHKAAVCPSCSKVLPLWNKHNHVKLYRGQVHEQRFHCDQCGKATKTSHGLEQHMICTYTLYARKFGLIVLKTFNTRNSEVWNTNLLKWYSCCLCNLFHKNLHKLIQDICLDVYIKSGKNNSEKIV